MATKSMKKSRPASKKGRKLQAKRPMAKPLEAGKLASPITQLPPV